MRDPNRIPKVMRELWHYWAQQPDLRLGQIIGNLTQGGRDPYYLEDDDLLTALEEANRV